MSTDKRELLQSQMSAEETHKESSSTKLTYNEEIPNTPFRVISFDEKNYYLCIGQSAISLPQKTPEDALYQLQSDMWNIITRICALMVSANDKIREQKAKEILEKKTGL